MARRVMRAALLAVVMACGSSAPKVAAPVAKKEPALAAPGPLGTEHQLILRQASYPFRWVVACQPRVDTDGSGAVSVDFGQHGEAYGDELVPYLMIGSGEGEAVDRFAGRSPSGRHVAVLQGGKLLVVDTSTGARTDLSAAGADSALDGNDNYTPRPISFDPRVARAAFMRKTAGATEVVMLDLATGDSKVIETSPHVIWRVEFDERAPDTLRILEVPADTDGNGKLDLPRLGTNRGGGPCPGPPASFSTYGYSGDKFTERTIAIPALREAPDRERLEPPDGHLCVADGRPIIARSSIGGVLVAAAREDEWSVPFGPVEWLPATDGGKCHSDR
jgi:hypothetical protein